MSYEPLHHKYRPQTFKDLIGQEAIATTLINAIKLEKIAPAYLFTGPRGTGKTSSARILAKSLNCLASNKPTATPCGKCEVCQAIASGNALDVIEIDAASNTGVDNIREIIERSRFAPVQSRYKVYAIDECHMLSTAAFNALLKTLEEPPPRVVFVLATTDPQRVLSTIISRCQRFDYRRIPLEAMIGHLKYIAEQENIAITLEALTLNAQIANGGLRDAESLLDQLSLFPEEITVDKIWDLVGAVPERDLLNLLISIRKEDVENIVTQCRNLLDRGREPLVLLQNLASFYLNLSIAKTSPNRQDLVPVTETCWQQLCTEAPYWQLKTILKGQQQLKEGEVQIKNTTQPRLWLEVILLGLLEKVATSETVTTQPAEFNSIERSPDTLHRGRSQTTAKDAASNKKQSIEQIDTRKTERESSVSEIQAIAHHNTHRDIVTPPNNSEAIAKSAEAISETKSATEFRADTANIRENSTTSDEQGVIWQQVIQCIHPPMTQALLRQQCHLISLTDSAAVVGISSAPLLKMNRGRIPNIETAFTKVCQRKIKVTLEVASAKKSPLTTEVSTFSKKRSQIQQDSPPVEQSYSDDTHRKKTQTVESSVKARSVTKQELNTERAITIEKRVESEAIEVSTSQTIEESAAEAVTPEINGDNVPIDSPISSSVENLDDFDRAVELVAQKFQGEVIELDRSHQLTISQEETLEITETTEIVRDRVLDTQTHDRVVVKRETISKHNYDDEDIPF